MSVARPLAPRPPAGESPPALGQFGHIRRYWDPQHEVYAAKLLPG